MALNASAPDRLAAQQLDEEAIVCADHGNTRRHCAVWSSAHNQWVAGTSPRSQPKPTPVAAARRILLPQIRITSPLLLFFFFFFFFLFSDPQPFPFFAFPKHNEDAVAVGASATAAEDAHADHPAPAGPAQSVSEAAADADAQQQQHILPRPLVIELPSARAAEEEPGADGDVDVDDVPPDVRCASWRLAAEANNLAPWKSVRHVRDYVTGAAYRSDLELVARESAAYARAAAPLAADGRDAWVFDVDETLLSNLAYYAEHGYGAELFDHHKFDEWVERGEAAAIPSSLRLYNEVRELGFKTLLLTGRSEGHRGVTAENLNKQGFHDWEKLILRAAGDRQKTAIVYKSEKRKEMEEEGYRILGNSGDQWSDLLGSSMSVRSFKLPNPMYYIP